MWAEAIYLAPRRWQNLQPLDGVRMSQEPSLGGRASQGTLRLRLHVARIRRIQLPLFALLLTDSGRRTELTRSNLLFFSPLLLLSLSLQTSNLCTESEFFSHRANQRRGKKIHVSIGIGTSIVSSGRSRDSRNGFDSIRRAYPPTQRVAICLIVDDE